MVALFSLLSSPPCHASLSPLRTLKLRGRPQKSLHFVRSLTVNSLLSPECGSHPQAIEAFWRWLRDEKLVSAKPPAKPVLVPEGLGLVAQRDIAKNEVVFEVPERFWINPEKVAASEIGKLCGGLTPWVAVALFLIRETFTEDSPWRYYIDILPDCTNSTLFWSEEELSEIQGTQLLSTTLRVKEYIQSEFSNVEEEVILPNRQFFPFPITLDDFFWAFGILRSRAFSGLPGQTLVLIPLVDLINHSPSIRTEECSYQIRGAGFFSRDLLFSLKSPVAVKAGEQVLIQYDLNKSNAELALDYGLIESRTDRNSYTLTLQISDSDPFFEDKLDIAQSNGMKETVGFNIVFGQPLPPAMLSYLRLVALRGTDSFLLESPFRDSVWAHLASPISRANEELVCQLVRNACHSALSGYRTTIEEDEKLKESGNLDPRVEMAVEIRGGEKKVLLQIDRLFEDKEKELDFLEYYQDFKLKELGLVGEQEEIIFWEQK